MGSGMTPKKCKPKVKIREYVKEKYEWYLGAMYHITTKGNRRSDLFTDGEDYVIYIAIVNEIFKATICCLCYSIYSAMKF